MHWDDAERVLAAAAPRPRHAMCNLLVLHVFSGGQLDIPRARRSQH